MKTQKSSSWDSQAEYRYNNNEQYRFKKHTVGIRKLNGDTKTVKTTDPKTRQLGFASLMEVQYQGNLQTPKPHSWDESNGDTMTMKTADTKPHSWDSQV